MRLRHLHLVVPLLLVAAATAAEAGVTRLEITRRETVLGGRPFGAAGPYEKVVGRVHFTFDPKAPRNQGIVDLALAPVNTRGLVEASADFYLLKPVDPARGNGRLFYEAGNRGTKRILPVFQQAAGADDPTSEAEFGNGALMAQGFTLLWMGWQWDVPAGRMRMQMPIATDQGRVITGLVRGNCALARRIAARLSKADGVAILNDVVLNQVLVQFGGTSGRSADDVTRDVIARVQAEGTCWAGGAFWQKKQAMRIAVSNWSTTEADIDRSADAILRCHEQVRAS